ncbi:31534587-2252-4c14-a076-203e52adcf4c [Sclerotinia trifoliorum]|uniref:31534587-2252-4c14-a076-203e52adcf4c n=1 Tax=Sclerotinia trifoliorum TaxID=28548 RepID=A0A8H2ZQC0_9HELO|nr:31534587-2252-4c14-a076-203e52adcf4c [Sclerotinia trifoliorum]
MHFSKKALAALVGSVTSANAAILWDGRFDSSTMSDLEAWSWSNAVGDYQNYIHGTSNFTNYIALDSTFKNPADSGSSLGAKITLDSTSYWEGQNMRRTELIPQTKAAIASGKVYYHFSMMHMEANAPSIYREHQICFFESHFTEMKSGWISGESGTSDPLLRWDVSGNSKWSTNWTAGVWHNVAYGIDFSAGSVEFYHSTGSDPLTLTVPAVSVSASSNGADWHLGVLELPVSGQTDGTEDFYFSGVYIESGSLTTSVAGPGGAVVSSSSSASTLVESSSIASSSSVPVVEASSVVASSETSVQAISTQAPISSSTVLSVTQSSSIAVPAQQTSSIIASSSATTKKSCTKKVSPGTTTTSIPQVSSPPSASIIEFTSTQAITSIEIIPTTIYITAGGSTILSTSSVSRTYTSHSAIITSSSILPIAIPSTFLTSKKPCTKKASSAALASSLSGNLNIASNSGVLTTSSIPHTTLTTTITQTSSTTVASSSSATTTAGSGSGSGSAGSLAKYAQCGGLNWTGSGTCVAGCTCKVQNDYYSQCL